MTKQEVKNLKAGDMFSFKKDMPVRVEVTNKIELENGDPSVGLEVRFVPCGDSCSSECQCLYALSGSGKLGQTIVLALPPKLRANNVVNLDDELREIEQRQLLVARLQRLKNGNGQTSEDSPLEPTHE